MKIDKSITFNANLILDMLQGYKAKCKNEIESNKLKKGETKIYSRSWSNTTKKSTRICSIL